MSWDDLRYFLAVSRFGSHAAAARSLGVAQSTISRRMSAFEKRLGVRLLERTPDGYVDTEVGRELRSQAERIEERMLASERIAKREASELGGEVHVTASDWLTTRVLSKTADRFSAIDASLTIKLTTSPSLKSLVRNEADLALRPRRFESHGVWQRAVGFAEFAMYASPSYLKRHRVAELTDGLNGHDLIMMDDSTGAVADVKWLTRVAPRARIRARINGREAMAAMAEAGGGLACLPTLVGEANRRLVRVDAITGAPGRTLWLGVHRDRKDLLRVRSVSDVVAELVGSALPRRRSGSHP